uniref:Immunoglobulin domain-containing protein n=1 Tax=Neogobius melanostomus TaxID=47308 RepID=A0A8C6TWK2_9GOBI
ETKHTIAAWLTVLLSVVFACVVLGKKVYTVTEGENFTAECWFHWSGSKKIFCKNNCKNKKDTLVETERNTGANNRYSIRYEEKTKKMFVSIKKVQMSDAGRYWCRLDRWIKNGYQEFKIKVIKGMFVIILHTATTTTTTATTTTVRPTHSPGLDLDPSPGTGPGSGETSGSSAPLPVDSHASTATGKGVFLLCGNLCVLMKTNKPAL